MSSFVPADEAGIASCVRAAFDAREPLLVEGGGTKGGMLRPVQAARTLSTKAVSGISLYAPQELILSARAGTPVKEIERVLSGKGQQLIAEPPDLSDLLGTQGEQTIGGVVGANLSGPRRIASGATRDHVMGVRAVDGTGAVFHSGGRVLKNVTGLDLCKLLAGSHGTLGVLTEVTLKVLPAAETTATIAVAGVPAEAGVAIMSAALGSPFGVTGAAWLPEAWEAAGTRGSAAVVRLEGFAASVSYRADRLVQMLRAHGVPAVIADAESQALWAAIRDVKPLPAAPADAVWRVSVRPSQGPGILSGTGLRGFLDWGGGLVWVAGPAASHQAVISAATRAGGVWTLMRGPDSLRNSVDVVPPEPAALAGIGRRVKAVMDPAGILNPGRLYAGV